jgi:glycosyltransferase involved in cell wall biosynthesis
MAITVEQRVSGAPFRAAPRVSVVLPCLNEVAAVAAVVAEARAALERAGVTGEVIVADNGSTDGSAEAARAAGANVVHAPVRGYGAAYHAGFAAATGDVIVMADADGTYDLSALPDLLRRIEDGDDLVVGSRFAGVIEDGAMPWTHRRVGSPALTGTLRLLYGVPVGDAHSGLRAFRRDALPRLRLRLPGMEMASEMIVNAARSGLRIGEVPIRYRRRIGRSKLHALRDGWRHLRFLFLYSPTHLFLIPGAALLGLGLAFVIALVGGPIRVGPLFLDIHFMVLGSLLALVGAQIAALGLYAKSLAFALDIQPLDRTLRVLRRVFSLERGLLAGSALFGVGFAVDAWIAATWLASGLGALDEVRPALFALTAMLLGMQIMFSSLFLSTVDMHAGRLGENA